MAAMSKDGSQKAKITAAGRGGSVIHTSLRQIIETDMLPVSAAEGQGVVWYLEPEYVMPKGSTVTKCIAKPFEKKKGKLKVKLAMMDKLALALIRLLDSSQK